MAIVLQSGVEVCPCLVHKAGSTQFRRLLLFYATGKVIANPHYWQTTLVRFRVQERPCSTSSIRLSIVRHPYDRMYSYYTDKYKHNNLVPPGVPHGLNFSEFVDHVVKVPLSAKGTLAAQHYEPITEQWSCVDKDYLKLEEAYKWFPVIRRRLDPNNRSIPFMRTFRYANTPKYCDMYNSDSLQLIQKYARNDFIRFNYSYSCAGIS